MPKQITPFDPFPQRRSDGPAFSGNVDSYFRQQERFVTEVNEMSAEVNQAAIQISTDKNTSAANASLAADYAEIAEAAANYVGEYSGARAYAAGQSVSNNGRYFVSKVDNNLGNTPGASPLQWQEVPVYLREVPSGSDVEAWAAMARDRYAGSGFIEMGKELAGSRIADGLYFGSSSGRQLLGFGRETSGTGVSRTANPVISAHGDRVILAGTRAAPEAGSYVFFPDAPNDASLLTRQDLVLFESWLERVSEKDVVYPYGNVQFGTATWGGVALTQPVDAAYSAFGKWEVDAGLAEAGRGLVWSTATANQRKVFINAPDNIHRLRIIDGELWQRRYRLRTVAGLGDDWLPQRLLPSVAALSNADFHLGYGGTFVAAQKANVALSADYGTPVYVNAAHSSIDDTSDTGAFFNSDGAVAIPLVLMQRRNQGVWHPQYNPYGTAALDDGAGGALSIVDMINSGLIASTDDCFTLSRVGGDYDSGVSGAPDGMFHDRVHSESVTDLRVFAEKVSDKQRALERYATKFSTGQLRGFEHAGSLEVVQLSDYTDAVYTNGVHNTNAAMTFIGTATGTFAYTAKLEPVADEGSILVGALGLVVKVFVLANTSTFNVRKLDGTTPTNQELTDNFAYPQQFLMWKRHSNLARPKSAEPLQCTIIGDPANYPASWAASGVYGAPLLIGDRGEDYRPASVPHVNQAKTWKLPRNIEGTSANFTVLRWNGTVSAEVTYGTADGQWEYSSHANTIIFNDDAWGTNFTDADVFLVFYKTLANPTEITGNADHIQTRAHVRIEQGRPTDSFGGYDVTHLLNMVPVDTGAFEGRFHDVVLTDLGLDYSGPRFDEASNGNVPKHATDYFMDSVVDDRAVKWAAYLAVEKRQVYLYVLFKELWYDGVALNHGDNGAFTVPSSGLARTPDDNGNDVITGTKRIRLPHFILDVE